jgi:hypothetical protein
VPQAFPARTSTCGLLPASEASTKIDPEQAGHPIATARQMKAMNPTRREIARFGKTQGLLPAMSLSLLIASSGVSYSSFCSSQKSPDVADLSSRVDNRFLMRMRQIGVRTIGRYYDYANETLVGKTLHKPERDQIAKARLKTLVVFQHHTDRFSSFTAQRGHDDAARAIELAAENRQPVGSAIYFGVDGGWGRTQSEKDAIVAYFTQASKAVRTGRFRVGAYGGGLVCELLLDAQLIDICWLANARSWPGYDSFQRSGKWALQQFLPENCGGKNVDFNVVNKNAHDYGDF